MFKIFAPLNSMVFVFLKFLYILGVNRDIIVKIFMPKCLCFSPIKKLRHECL